MDTAYVGHSNLPVEVTVGPCSASSAYVFVWAFATTDPFFIHDEIFELFTHAKLPKQWAAIPHFFKVIC